MLFNTKPIRDPLLIVSMFQEKSMYKTRQEYKMTSKQITVLFQCVIIQRYTNKLVSRTSLRSIVPGNIYSIDRFITVLIDKGYLTLIDPPHKRKSRTGEKVNRMYNVSIEGMNVVKFFEKWQNRQINKFKESSKWKRINPASKKYFDSIGVIR